MKKDVKKGLLNSMTNESTLLLGRNDQHRKMNVIVIRFIPKKLIKSPSLLTMTNKL